MRITNSITQRSVLNGIQRSYERLSTYQKQIATGLRIGTPSDDPVGLSRVFWLANSLSQVKQYESNIDMATDEINGAANVIDNVLDSLLRVKEIAVNASNGIISQSALDAGAIEVEQILTNLVSSANTNFNNKYIFSGFRTNTIPFTPTIVGGLITGVVYNGDQGQRVIEISTNRSMIVNFAGSSAVAGSPGVFIDGTVGVNIFNTLIQLRNDLAAGNISNIMAVDQPSLSQYTSYLEGLAGQLGVNSKEIQDLRQSHEADVLYKTNLRADIEEADPYVAMSNMSNEQVAYQAALQVGARIFQVNLFDFLT